MININSFKNEASNGKTAKELALIFSVGCTTVRRFAAKHSIAISPPPKRSYTKQVLKIAEKLTEPVNSNAIAKEVGCTVDNVRKALRDAGVAYIRNSKKVSKGRKMDFNGDFDDEDCELIEQLFQSGESLKSVADKWDVTVETLRKYCRYKRISIPRAPHHIEAARVRRLVESGAKPSAVVMQIIQLHKSGLSIDEIHKDVKRSKAYVTRMIDVYFHKDYSVRHQKRIDEVARLSAKHDITLTAALAMIGIGYGAYAYSCKVVDNKKALR